MGSRRISAKARQFAVLASAVLVLHAHAAVAAAQCVVTPIVDRHMIRPAMDASLRPTLSWTLSDDCGPAPQTAFRAALYDHTAKLIWQSKLIRTNRSDSVPWIGEGSNSLNPDGWMNGVSSDYRALAPGTSYAVSVQVTLAGKDPVWSAPVPFHTQMQPKQYAAAPPMWASNMSAEYVMLRRTIAAQRPGNHTFLSVSAKPSPDWRLPHGRNTSHLLCAYKLWVNGVPLGAGPGRIVGSAAEVDYDTGAIKQLSSPIAVDTYNITALIREGKGAAIAIESYYRRQPSTEDRVGADPDDSGGVIAVLHDSSGSVMPGGAATWKSMDVTPAFNPSLQNSPDGSRRLQGEGAGTGSYAQPHENIDLRYYPQGWREIDFDDSSWAVAGTRRPFDAALAAKEALPVSLRSVRAASFDILSKVTDSTGAESYHYIVDFGKNFQGHVNISFGSGQAGQQVVVSLGEQRTADGVVSHAESNNVWIDTWTLAGGNSTDSFVPHEYAEFRWAEVQGAPEPPSHARVAGWMVHYPFDGLIEPPDGGAMHTDHTYEAKMSDQPARGLTTFNSSVPELDNVWELVRHTINVAALDLNTDSNTRQRDLCTLDAWLATRYQGGVAPGSSSHLRRRVTRSMFEPNGYVNYWTEFLVAHVGALYDYTVEYADQGLTDTLWNQAPISMGSKCPAPLGMDNYSLLTYYNDDDQLVHATPRPLIDWPRASGIDTNEKTSSHCNQLCVQMNAYAALAQRWMGELSARSGGAGRQESASFSERAAGIQQAAHRTFAASGSECDTSSAGPSPPIPSGVTTCAQVWEADTPLHHHNSSGVVALNCGAGNSISSVLSADFGLPSGSCATGFKSNSSCHSDRASTVAAVERACLHKQFCFLEASRTQFGDSCAGECKQLAVQVECSRGGGTKTQGPEPTLKCYTDEPTRDPEAPPGFTSATATSLAAFAGLPGDASGVLELVPFLKARNGRRGPGHGMETSGWMTGFMLEGIYTVRKTNDRPLSLPLLTAARLSLINDHLNARVLLQAAGDVHADNLTLALALSAVDYAHDTLTNAGNNSWLGMLRQNATMTMESWTQPPFEGNFALSIAAP